MAIPRNLANIAPHVNASSTELVVNDGGANLDFRVEGDTNANLLFVDAGNNRVGINTSTPAVEFDLKGSSTNGQIRFAGSGSTINRLYGDDDGIVVLSADTGNTAAGSYMAFQVDGSERSRITSGGYFKASTNGTYANAAAFHEMYTTNSNWALRLTNTNASPFGIQVIYSGASPNNTTQDFLNCGDTTATRAYILSNGTYGSATNTYGAISDIKLKQDVIDAGSQWEDVKALQIKKYRFKTDPEGFLQLGVVAQDVEQVSPGLVFETLDYQYAEVTDEDGNVTTERQATGTTTKSVKYSVLYMKAVKALQEAMERIETLEAKVAALEAQ